MNPYRYRVVNKRRRLSSLVVVALFIIAQFISMYCGMEFIASLGSMTALATIQHSDDIRIPDIVVLNPFLKAKRDPVELSSTIKLKPDPPHLSSIPRFTQGNNYRLLFSNIVPPLHSPASDGFIKTNNLWLINRVLLI